MLKASKPLPRIRSRSAFGVPPRTSRSAAVAAKVLASACAICRGDAFGSSACLWASDEKASMEWEGTAWGFLLFDQHILIIRRLDGVADSACPKSICFYVSNPAVQRYSGLLIRQQADDRLLPDQHIAVCTQGAVERSRGKQALAHNVRKQEPVTHSESPPMQLFWFLPVADKIAPVRAPAA